MSKKAWWQKPGFGIMYQIEARPGYCWNRNYEKFNASVMDKDGNLKFNGPFCKMADWVAFSKSVGVDYHIFEAKWHDGICYFDTQLTNWKTPVDYCAIFAEESRKMNIPFMFYYSSIFDHNPQFDDIQPNRTITPSFFSTPSNTRVAKLLTSLVFTLFATILFSLNRFRRKYPKIESAKWFDDFRLHSFTNNPRKYQVYMFKQLREMIEKYKPDGMWMDWYMFHFDYSAHQIMEFMKKEYPDVVLTFNSIGAHFQTKYAHYTASETHDVRSAWAHGNKYRRLTRPWEQVGPAAEAWDYPRPRHDPYEVARTAAIIMASGGKMAFGMPAQMNGTLYSGPSKHLEMFGAWYKPRRELFTESVPMNYKGKKVPGVKVKVKSLKTIGSINDNDYLIHLIRLFSVPKTSLVIELSYKKWSNLDQVVLEPESRELEFQKTINGITLTIPKQQTDPVDTILRIKMSK